MHIHALMSGSYLLGLPLQDGKSIISGWSDGKIRAFGPQTGKLLYTINDAHHKAVTALAATSDSKRLISGGEEGEHRLRQTWK
jgi:WD40 repeat protein